ncbi:MAG TPA: hypothetical protein PLE45_09895 [Spirochaetota bacterium]|nr:hypothetical protein [Spirochaetota bacterium]HOL57430.1 hypothetical protein [Spirochaetota bacterium]HPP04996.1 hypothetical protein [Spirochaetota bacterium]
MKHKVLFLLLLFSLFCCCVLSPDFVLLRYLNSVRKNNLKLAYKFLSEEDKNIISYDEFIKYEKSVFDNLLKKNTKYKIITSTLSETKNRAMIKVDIYQPDLILLFAHFPELTKENITEEEIDKIARSIKIKEYLKIYENEFILVKEKNEWKVFADYGRKKKIKELEDLAMEKYKNDEYEESLNIVNKLFQFEDFNKTAKNLLIKNKEKIDYIKKYIEFSYYKKDDNIIINIENKGNMIVKKLTVEIKSSDKREIFYIIGNEEKKYIEVDEKYSTKIKYNGMIEDIKIKGIDF